MKKKEESEESDGQNQFTILRTIPVNLTITDLEAKFAASRHSSQLLDTATDILSALQNCWQPKALYGWFALKNITENTTTLSSRWNGEDIVLHTGYSGCFLHPAEVVMAGLYTSGNELEDAARQASLEKNYLESYIIEQIGLIVLEKTGAALNSIIEKEASARSWGVGPLLSPGSVHGWDLMDQPKLCTHFPLAQISVQCSENGVLTPFNSLSFIIGIGPKYRNKMVGSPCEVCSNREKCSLRKENNVS